MARLPKDKVQNYQSVIQEAIVTDHITSKLLQSLIGKLQFVTSSRSRERCFTRRLYDVKIGKMSPFSKITLSQDAIGDLHMWLSFLRTQNGIEIVTQPAALAHTLCADAFLTSYLPRHAA